MSLLYHWPYLFMAFRASHLATCPGLQCFRPNSVALLALLVGLMLAVPLAKATAPTASNTPLCQHLHIQLPCIYVFVHIEGL